MNINIKATGTTLTPALKNIISEKLSILNKFLKSEHKLHVEVEYNHKHKSGQVYRAEITIMPEMYYAEARGSEAYEALDLVVPKIKDQLTKHKDKMISERRRQGAKAKRG